MLNIIAPQGHTCAFFTKFVGTSMFG